MLEIKTDAIGFISVSAGDHRKKLVDGKLTLQVHSNTWVYVEGVTGNV
jgi:hypothetical protein